MSVFCLETNLISRGIKPSLRYIQILLEIISFIFLIVYHCFSISELLNSAIRLVVSGYNTSSPIISSAMNAGM